MAMAKIDTGNFDVEVLKSKVPVVIDFWAAWCGPCRIFSPIIEDVSKEMDGKAKFGSINTDENPDIAAKYNIMSIPTTMIFQNGQPKAFSVGALPKEALKRWISENL